MRIHVPARIGNGVAIPNDHIITRLSAFINKKMRHKRRFFVARSAVSGAERLGPNCSALAFQLLNTSGVKRSALRTEALSTSDSAAQQLEGRAIAAPGADD